LKHADLRRDRADRDSREQAESGKQQSWSLHGSTSG
jgi:hypothetical protein